MSGDLHSLLTNLGDGRERCCVGRSSDRVMFSLIAKLNLSVVLSSGVVAALASQSGLIPAAIPGFWLILPIVLLFVAFWAVFALSVRAQRGRRANRLLGPAIYAGTVLTLMVGVFGKPFAGDLSGLIGTSHLLAPAFCGGMLVAWLAIEMTEFRRTNATTDSSETLAPA